ncbi:hypothetical protein IHV25_06120 [Phaeovibrio sulfidiphilus]|uniref:Uncharacterized protein n=1 Tax=Phaeovibrio sulfidiphilus TaxID=1220600 RepID=A0A8J6YJ22_9PROT|nr:hypothetical protein [Phaeovibrio sulfidiphilus]MBE1237221.1 hypothetical protein [Phaeovibrio sulfidiphilus]
MGNKLLDAVKKYNEADKLKTGGTSLMLSPKEMLVWSVCRLFDGWKAVGFNGKPIRYEKGSRLQMLVEALINDVVQLVIEEDAFPRPPKPVVGAAAEQNYGDTVVADQWRNIGPAYFKYRSRMEGGIAAHVIPFVDRG